MPVFIFSLPRSGSTLLQRLLASHNQVSTASETWLLLPLLYSLRTQGIYTEYWQKTSVLALNDFMERLPNGKADYQEAMRQLALQLYTKASDDGASYFLDKTPRYHLISDEVCELFPDAKLIFLWRNPLSVIASIMQSFADGKWNLYYYNIDLFTGLENIIHTYENYRSSSLSVHFEALIKSPEEELKRINEYLELEDHSHMDLSSSQLSGKMGDPTGTKLYSQVSAEPLGKWKEVICNRLRRRWCRKYLERIGRDRWLAIGYDMDDMIAELNAVPMSSRFLVSDVVRITYGTLLPFLSPRSLKEKAALLPDFNKIYPSY
ncbi:Sulfotransferase family protein [Mariprofundus aestuarium]|uniref:Sulfotransferase family protein n=2 Tax=Mariprofundus aestuarium TaxID=1921086 RepID=A0A2K8KXJ6_MARES|nr:Sulfotransferase family protein [Mariprofundus aestuarium]